MKTLLYFHGLGSSAASKKFVRIQNHFGNTYQIVCPEWNDTTDVELMLANLFKQYENQTSITMIGSSTGCNFAYQLADQLRAKGVEVKLILINPLLQLGQRISNRPFPDSLVKYLWDIKEVNQCTLILGNLDEVIDHSMITIGKDVDVIKIDDDHQLKDLDGLIKILEGLVKVK